MDELGIIVVGASGRMGRMLVKTIADAAGCRLTGATERQGSPFLGRDAGELAGVGTQGVRIVDDLAQCPPADVIIDFTAPQATLAHAEHAASRGMAMVIGTTGFDANQLTRLREILLPVPTVMAANYSVGVNLMLELVRRASSILGNDYDAEIFEAHHRHKVDAPSGTALAIGRALAEGRGVALDDVAVFAREGITGERKTGSIGFSVVRGGNIIGEHKAMFIAEEERLEINHVAADRGVFAKGAVRAATWLRGRRPGWYSMRDVLGLSEV
ncbi:MAG: 4-hydroxy-tetrahydrodipicolinate reductase [Zetaproteobacteria bacterium]|nr:MAG: 4-hydroxy-tetrahydrodipicolinate reductase [Zetaproteobacteria bacterium]